jgi:hypothetical protein
LTLNLRSLNQLLYAPVRNCLTTPPWLKENRPELASIGTTRREHGSEFRAARGSKHC